VAGVGVIIGRKSNRRDIAYFRCHDGIAWSLHCPGWHLKANLSYGADLLIQPNLGQMAIAVEDDLGRGEGERYRARSRLLTPSDLGEKEDVHELLQDALAHVSVAAQRDPP
jgi:hypothetical protein